MNSKLILFILIITATAANAQVCDDTISTTFAGGSGEDGNMFNITAINTIEITQFEGNINGNGGIQVYYKVGTYQGSENNSGAWTFINSATVTSNGVGVPTPIPFSINVTIPAGQTYAFYITGDGTGATLDYTNGTLEGSVYVSDGNLEVREGIGIKYPFFTIFTPKVWNGIVHYSPIIGTNTATTDVTCNGGNNGSVVLSVSGGGTLPYDYMWSSGDTTLDTYSTTDTITGLSAGTYTCTVTDSSGCNTTASVSISQPSAISLSFSTTSASCLATCNGTATVTPSGGTGSYTYLWAGGQTDSTVTGLCVGTDTVIVTDANGCTAISNVNISALPGISLFFSTTDAFCTGVCDGSAMVTPSGGTLPYSYQWNDALLQTNDTAIDLCAETYSVLVTDSNGCQVIENASISQQFPISLSSNVTDDSCSACIGSVIVIPSSTVPPHTFLWNTGDTDSILTNLCAGTYTVTVTNDSGCIAIDNIIVNTANPIIKSASETNAVSCNGGSDGMAKVVMWNPNIYDVFWSSGDSTFATWDTVSFVTGLSAGTYSVTIIDPDGCTETATVTITEPDLISINIITSDANCGVADGSAEVMVSGGTGSYIYSWSSGGTGSLETGLSAGIYFLIITDANGCIKITQTIISELGGATITLDSIENISCNGDSDGAIYIAVSGGILPYSYSWSNGDTTKDINNLTADVYDVIVTDSGGCIFIQSITLTEPAAIDITVAVDDIIPCNGGTDGIIAANLTGGASPYKYIWSTGDSTVGSTSSTNTITGLSAGIYSVTVTDYNGCTAVDTTNLNEPDSLILSDTVNNVSCQGEADGVVTVNLTGGISPYNYYWSTGASTVGTTLLTNTISGLTGSIYTVIVTDFNGCTAFDSVSIIEPDTINLMVTVDNNVTCNGGSNGMVTVNIISGGITPYSYIWSSGGSTLGSTDTTNSEIGLPAGTYSVTVTDVNGCFAVGNVTVTEAAALNLTINESFANCGLDDGMAWVVINGGIAPYSYLWDDLLGQTSDTAFNLYAGIYAVLVTDSNGCMETETTIVNNLGGPVIAVDSVLNVSCNGDNDGAVYITVSNGTSPYIYLWSNSDISEDISNLSGGIYIVNVTDANSCQAYGFIIIDEPPTIVLTVGSIPDTSGAGLGIAWVNVIGSTSPYSYQWNDPFLQTTDTAYNLTAGNYTVIVTDNTGCRDSSNVIVDDAAGLAPVTDFTADYTNITVGDTVNFFDLSANNPTSWSWIFTNGNPTFSNSQNPINVTYSTPGSYDVTLTSTNNFGTDTKIKTGYINVSLGTGVEKFEFPDAEFKVYPNPNTGQFTLETDLQEETRLSIKLYHFTGALIYSEEISNFTGDYIQQIDLSEYTKGIYYVQVVTEGNVITRKVVYH